MEFAKWNLQFPMHLDIKRHDGSPSAYSVLTVPDQQILESSRAHHVCNMSSTLKVPRSKLISQQLSTCSSLRETLSACAEWTPSPIHGYNRTWTDGYAWQDVVCTPQLIESLETCKISRSKPSTRYIVTGP